jgi:hypothetical protein
LAAVEAACTDESGEALGWARSTLRGGGSSGAIYGWFAEGFDTQDLKDARALLDELA